jgi:hypothetical protein
VRYIGTPKDEVTAKNPHLGMMGKIGLLCFLSWFYANGLKVNASVDTTDLTLYGVLSLKRDCPGTDIKTAWRRMAKRYHPDVNKDDDAAAMMIRINEAYEVLNNPMKRKKYDAGLVLVASLKDKPRDRLSAFSNIWRPPERCGFILADGISQLGRFVIQTIHQWEPIKDAYGRELVTSWPMGADTYQENWV